MSEVSKLVLFSFILRFWIFDYSSIGNHDGDYGVAVNPVSAAIIIADKTDVRRCRVRDKIIELFDVHGRVNYSVVRSDLEIDNQI